MLLICLSNVKLVAHLPRKFVMNLLGRLPQRIFAAIFFTVILSGVEA